MKLARYESFSHLWGELDFAATRAALTQPRYSDPARVERLLDRLVPGELSDDDLLLLLSPAAAPFLEELAQRARSLTRQRFGNVMLLYAPLYLSSECRSECLYCGFRRSNPVARRTLSADEVVREAAALRREGIRHVLLLTGEELKATPIDYIAEAARSLRDDFGSIAIEIYPLHVAGYERLREAGVDAMTLYQETYDPERYRQLHKAGMKKRLKFRLDGPDRAGMAGIRRITVGALMGLADPATDVFFAAQHARYLQRRYWQSQIQLALPRLRLRGLPDFSPPPLAVSDAAFVQYLIALRLYLPDCGLVLSTRESPALRDALSEICITTMSAGSRTDPGGYAGEGGDGQFAIEDDRSVADVSAMLTARGLEPLLLDWSREMR